MKRIPQSQRRGLAAAATFVLLYGCGNQPVKTDPLPIVQPTQQVNVDPTLMTYCPTVPHLSVQKYSQRQTLDPVKFWQNLYTECAGKQRKLVDLAADAFKLPKPQPPAPASAPVISQ